MALAGVNRRTDLARDDEWRCPPILYPAFTPRRFWEYGKLRIPPQTVGEI
jgi:hypothetical protein